MSERCPRCAALLPASSQWCGLCHYDLRPQPEPEPVPQPVLQPEPAGDADPALVSQGVRPDGAAAEAVSRPRGRHARHEADGPAAGATTLTAEGAPAVIPVRDPHAPSVVDTVDFSVLAGAGGAALDPKTAQLTAWGSKLTTTGAKAGVMAVVVLAVAVVGVIGLSIVGFVL